MKIGLHLKPGQKGTKKLLDKYGDRLICVRYRYDKERKKRLKTIELIVEEVDWDPIKTIQSVNEIVYVQVNLEEKELQKRIKAVGGKWNYKKKLWEIPSIKKQR